MSSSASGAKDNEGSRLGGARADFVASLGRKVADARELLVSLEEDPSSKPARDELRRRMHALGAGARLLRFDAMARSIQEALAVLERGGQMGALREQDVAFVAQVLDDLPALAWGESPAREREPGIVDREPAEAAPGQLPITVLVVGEEALADALTEDAGMRPRTIECERTEDAQSAVELARAYAPDVMVVDADVPRAGELVETLLDDPLTEPVPIVVVGTFRHPDDSARFVALGVAKALPKPVAPDLLRGTCDEILDARDGRTMRVTLGEPTLEQLADRLADEIKRALVDSVDRPARSCRVPLGEGTEVLGALWGAIARVQEVVTQKTGGTIRFGGDAPEGAIALAPWLHQDVAGSDRTAGRGRGAATDVRLAGRRVVVADDDPGVTWFISDLLRTAGCEVHEALDGNTALERAFQVQPELVVSDILMPGMDGFALCRALRRDVALRDTPVILLSWKEDLLQRVRELGASAAAYMRKESDSRAILARVREVLRPRARIEMRIRGDGEVRGRLDELTPRLLLELVGIIRRDARVSVRDATYLYEIEVRDGAPRKATRTASDGGYQSGERALAGLLGVGAGRFVVAPSREPIRGELTGSLFEQLARPVAAARGALAATTGARTMNVERIHLDDAILEEYLRSTPEPARGIIKRLGRGVSPRQMLLAAEVAPSLLEDVLADLAARGAVRAVDGPNGIDFLTPAVDSAFGLLRDAGKPRRSLPPNARPSVVPAPVVVHARSAEAFAAEVAAPKAAPAYETLTVSDPPPPPAEEDEGAPSSLEDAVTRAISDRSPDPGAVRSVGSNPPPIVEPSQLRKRSSNPPELDVPDGQSPLGSIPPDAMVPGASSSEEILASAPASGPELAAPPAARPVEAAPAEGDWVDAEPDFGEATEPISPLEDIRQWEPLAVLTPEPAVASAPTAAAASVPVVARAPAPVAAPASAPALPRTPAPAVAPTPAPALKPAAAITRAVELELELEPAEPEPPHEPPAPTDTQPLPPPERTQPLPKPAAAPAKPAPLAAKPAAAPAKPAAAPSKVAPTRAARARWQGPWPFALAFGALVAVVAAVVRLTSGTPTPPEAMPDPTPPASTPMVSSIASPSAVLTAPGAIPSTDPSGFADVPPGAEVPLGLGLVEVSAPAGARVLLDGALAGNGPSVQALAGPGSHEVRLQLGDRETKQVIEVRAGRSTRVTPTLAP
jgi:CheY-like chemotaxis protein